MGRGPNDDAEFDEFNAWARWVAEHDDLDSPFSAPDDGRAAREES